MNEKEIKAGWRIVTGILACLVLVSLLRLLLPLMLGSTPGLGSLVGFALMLWLCWLVYQGNSVARVILILLLLVNAGMSLLGGAVLGAGLIVGIGIIQLLFGAALFLIPQVNRYFEYAKNY